MLPSSRDLFWTKHAQQKLIEYNLSQSRVLRVLRHPHRIEEGIAPETIAVMQRAGSKKHPYEVWVMYQLEKKKIKIISAWKYPGRSPEGKIIYIPPDTLEFLSSQKI